MSHNRGPSVSASTFAIPDDGTEISTSSSDSSYAGSARQLESEFSAVNYLNDQFGSVFDQTILDRTIATQAQTSGVLNAKSKELEFLLKQAIERISSFKTVVGEGISTARQTQRDLEIAFRKSKSLENKAKAKFPIEYEQAKEIIYKE